MKASRAAVKQAKAVTSLEAKVDLILAHLGIEVPAEGEEQAEPKVVSEPWTEAQQAEWDALSPEEQKTIRDTNLVAQGLQEPATQLDENRQRLGSRGKPAAASKSARKAASKPAKPKAE